MAIRTCKVCNQDFESRAHNAKYCPNCRYEAYLAHNRQNERNLYRHPCPTCGVLIDRKSTLCHHCTIKKRGSRYKGLNRYRTGPRKQSMKVNGYIKQYCPNHPYCDNHGFVLCHRLIMETKIGCYLEKGEIIHHLNGIRDDNRPQNLVIVRAHSHTSWTYIKSLQGRIRDLEAQLAQRLLPLQS